MRQRRSAAHSRPDAKRTRKSRHEGSPFCATDPGGRGAARPRQARPRWL